MVRCDPSSTKHNRSLAEFKEEAKKAGSQMERIERKEANYL